MTRMDAFVADRLHTKRERMWASTPHRMFAVCLLAAQFAGAWGPLLYLAPLVVAGLLVWRPRATSAFVAEHAKESFQFQLMVYAVFLAAYCVNRARPEPDNPTILVVVVLGAEFSALWLSWIAGERAWLGSEYRYPVSLRIGH
jgi:uncharacterized Tic20 family protein